MSLSLLKSNLHLPDPGLTSRVRGGGRGRGTLRTQQATIFSRQCPVWRYRTRHMPGLELPQLDLRGTCYLVITPWSLRCLELPQLEQHAVEHAVLAPEARGLTGLVARAGAARGPPRLVGRPPAAAAADAAAAAAQACQRGALVPWIHPDLEVGGASGGAGAELRPKRAHAAPVVVQLLRAPSRGGLRREETRWGGGILAGLNARCAARNDAGGHARRQCRRVLRVYLRAPAAELTQRRRRLTEGPAGRDPPDGLEAESARARAPLACGLDYIGVGWRLGLGLGLGLGPGPGPGPGLGLGPGQ
eukprot:scaffold57223_cov48-Phaeocystis_antarctica.AAC.1